MLIGIIVHHLTGLTIARKPGTTYHHCMVCGAPFERAERGSPAGVLLDEVQGARASPARQLLSPPSPTRRSTGGKSPVIHRLVVTPYPPARARRPRQHMHALCHCQSTEASNNNTTQRGKKAGGDLPGDPDGHGNVGKVFGELLWFLQQGGNPSGFFARLREHLLQRKAQFGCFSSGFWEYNEDRFAACLPRCSAN